MRRWAELDRAKGLAIILVVFGHLVAREDPVGVTWYGPLRMVVYLFHMPFFFYLSGYVAVLSGAAEHFSGAAARRRALRLLVPFMGFGLLILLGKLALGRLMMVDNMPAGLVPGLWALLWDTGRSPATSVWYLVVLFVYATALPWLLRWLGGPGLLALGGALFVLPVPQLAYLDRICGYFVFFAAGVVAAQAGARWLAWIDHWRAPVLALFAAILAVAWSGAVPVLGRPHAAWLLGAGLLSMPALHALVRQWRAPGLVWLGEWVFPIYLLNTICIGLAKALLMPLLGWTSDTFPLFAVILMAAGLFGPVAVQTLSARATLTVHRQFVR
jgi:fucose 4-O-acetylase-like acetyltransferase